MEVDKNNEMINDQLEILVNDKDEVLSYAIVGGVGSEALSVPYSKVPKDFREVFEYKYFKYKNGEIIKNPDYSPETQIE
ncbi:DUF2977 domain-containing protein [Staphylococcus pseudoxylosus]|uniref:DUF2977 domain-containing protein n=1 Tax=Staphylococcus pseudoxylosus TaxID=2282419 RepID=UPI002DBCC638|nr:DUF2977 domain-containing protein [Staphylococcus pseudoxylosus]MEB5782394.1 DUF2977 domain-containing protein [Staphylococcus pseudoxylosus]